MSLLLYICIRRYYVHYHACIPTQNASRVHEFAGQGDSLPWPLSTYVLLITHCSHCVHVKHVRRASRESQAAHPNCSTWQPDQLLSCTLCTPQCDVQARAMLGCTLHIQPPHSATCHVCTYVLGMKLCTSNTEASGLN